MIKWDESTALIVITIITGIAALFTLIGLATPKWLSSGFGLWNCKHVCSTSSAILTILALLFLVTAVVLLVLLLLRLFPRYFRLLPLALLAIATLFLLISTANYLRHFGIVSYSFELVVTAHALAFIASIMVAFWLGTTMDESGPAITTRPSIPLTMQSIRTN